MGYNKIGNKIQTKSDIFLKHSQMNDNILIVLKIPKKIQKIIISGGKVNIKYFLLFKLFDNNLC